MSTVVFDPVAFKLRYPEFETVDDALLEAYFVDACLIQDPTDNSRVVSEADRAVLLNMLVAHICKLEQSKQAPGQINSASEGSVSVGLTPLPGSKVLWAFLNQTPYGALYLASTSQYRTMMYIRYEQPLYTL